MGPNLIDPAILHRQATQHAFDLDTIPWAQGIDPTRHFAPEAMAQLYHSPSYQLLDADERREFSRVVGLALAEMFIYLEEILLVPAVGTFMAKRGDRLSPDLRACLVDFIEEERKHAEMFWRLLELAAPEAYPTRKPLIYGARPIKNLGLQVMVRLPEVCLCWLWLALIFEERTIDLYRKYQAAPEADPLFASVHRYHMQDETRHVSIDQHLLAELWDPAPMWLRRLNVKLLSGILGMFTSPTTSPMTAVDAVIAKSPRLQARRADFERDIAGLRENMAFQQAHYSREVLPRTFALMDRYPEMAAIRTALPLYTPVAP
ncbi:P-aminobenzoate N-oxygenase AurF [compost metagenome]